MTTPAAAVASITLTNAQTWRNTADPYARDQYLKTLMSGLGVSPIDDFAVDLARHTCKNLLGVTVGGGG